MTRPVFICNAARTPWCRVGGALSAIPAATLGGHAARDTLLRVGGRPGDIDMVVVGSGQGAHGTALASEVAAAAGLHAHAFRVSAGGVSSEQALSAAKDAIALGRCDAVIVVGVETPSRRTVALSQPLREAVASTKLADTAAEKLRAWTGLRAGDLKPLATPTADPVTGESLASVAEGVALRFDIDRDAQDRLAYRSHQRAARAWQADHIRPRLVAMPRPVVRRVDEHNQVSAVEIVERDDGPLRPLSERSLASEPTLVSRDPQGRVPTAVASVTAGNLAQPCDGAAAVLLATPDAARARGWTTLACLDDIQFGREDPQTRPWMGGAAALRRLMDGQGLELDAIEVLEMTEAAAATSLAVVASFPELDPRVVNRWGGALGYGRCDGADGLRMLTHALDRLIVEGGGVAAVASSAQAGLGAAVLLRI